MKNNNIWWIIGIIVVGLFFIGKSMLFSIFDLQPSLDLGSVVKDASGAPQYCIGMSGVNSLQIAGHSITEITPYVGLVGVKTGGKCWSDGTSYLQTLSFKSDGVQKKLCLYSMERTGTTTSCGNNFGFSSFCPADSVKSKSYNISPYIEITFGDIPHSYGSYGCIQGNSISLNPSMIDVMSITNLSFIMVNSNISAEIKIINHDLPSEFIIEYGGALSTPFEIFNLSPKTIKMNISTEASIFVPLDTRNSGKERFEIKVGVPLIVDGKTYYRQLATFNLTAEIRSPEDMARIEEINRLKEQLANKSQPIIINQTNITTIIQGGYPIVEPQKPLPAWVNPTVITMVLLLVISFFVLRASYYKKRFFDWKYWKWFIGVNKEGTLVGLAFGISIVLLKYFKIIDFGFLIPIYFNYLIVNLIVWGSLYAVLGGFLDSILNPGR